MVERDAALKNKQLLTLDYEHCIKVRDQYTRLWDDACGDLDYARSALSACEAKDRVFREALQLLLDDMPGAYDKARAALGLPAEESKDG